MALKTRRGSTLRRFWHRLAPAMLPGGSFLEGRRGTFGGRQKGRRALTVEQLEARTLLSASILGNVRSDLNGDGSRQGSEAGLPGVTVYLDGNNNHTFDHSIT